MRIAVRVGVVGEDARRGRRERRCSACRCKLSSAATGGRFGGDGGVADGDLFDRRRRRTGSVRGQVDPVLRVAGAAADRAAETARSEQRRSTSRQAAACRRGARRTSRTCPTASWPSTRVHRQVTVCARVERRATGTCRPRRTGSSAASPPTTAPPPSVKSLTSGRSDRADRRSRASRRRCRQPSTTTDAGAQSMRKR